MYIIYVSIVHMYCLLVHKPAFPIALFVSKKGGESNGLLIAPHL